MPARSPPDPSLTVAGEREMTKIARKSDGRRIFTEHFKRKHISRVWRGEVTVAELGRRLGIARSLLQRWKRLLPDGDGVAGSRRTRSNTTNGSHAALYVRELQILVGKQSVELELLRAEVTELRKSRHTRAARNGDR